MPMSIFVKTLSDRGFFLRVEDTDTPPPKGAPQPDGSIKLEAAAAAGLLKALSVEALRAAMDRTVGSVGGVELGSPGCGGRPQAPSLQVAIDRARGKHRRKR